MSPSSSSSQQQQHQQLTLYNTGPILLRPQETPSDVICSICMSIPLDPVITPECQHLFCYDCIRQSIKEHQPCCPIDRTPCLLDSLKRIGQDCSPFIHRIWCNVQVKCENCIKGCCWIGSIADYTKHYENDCHYNTNNTINNIKMNRRMPKRQYNGTNYIEDDVEYELHGTNYVEDDDEYELRNLEIEMKNVILEEKVRELENKNETLANTLSEYKRNERMKEQMDQNTLRPTTGTFDIHYNYSSRNIIKLNEFIATYLEDKPNIVSSQRIFLCVQRCHTYYKKAYKKNHPEGYKLDVRMLLATCAACNWFTANQFSHIREWLNDGDW